MTPSCGGHSLLYQSSYLKTSSIIISLFPVVQNGGDLTLPDGYKHTPQFYAKSSMDQAILSILVANGCVDDISDASSNIDVQTPQIHYQQ